MEIKDKVPVLVALMKDTFDFEILKRYHWCRIPVKSAPNKLKENKYIAFYQAKVFGDEKWKVNCIAKIHNIEVVRRVDLLLEEKNHPKAQNDYYKIKIGRLMKLQNPIPSKSWRRIVFISTTMEKLLKEKELNDLFNESPLEDILWLNLKRITDVDIKKAKGPYGRAPSAPMYIGATPT